MMMADTMEALGIARGDYVVRVNNRKVLDGVMEAIGVTDENQKLAVLRAIDKLDKFGVEGVRLLLGEAWDGARTKAATSPRVRGWVRGRSRRSSLIVTRHGTTDGISALP